ncbi:MAG: L-2-amino-thiazoline-4-carboxylic acid hydrolase [Clostridiales Family XIII bacterium]|jgi:hypothetical protein|nr:L-2-amino-thiazoline-4-carboxylic acid hydrolase [Clostridiales Family XIII bacterium]
MISNNPTKADEKAVAIRGAIEHRATWFYMLLDEARKRGLDMEELGRAAVFRCGCFHGTEKMMKNCKDPSDLRAFWDVFADETVRQVFGMELVENTADKLYVDFHYCPLLAAWGKIGAAEEDYPLLCDIAMEGDRGIISKFDGYEFRLDGVLAKGDPVCKIRIDKK